MRERPPSPPTYHIPRNSPYEYSPNQNPLTDRKLGLIDDECSCVKERREFYYPRAVA